MFATEISRKIKELQSQLAVEGERYVDAVRSHKDNKTLRAYRESMNSLKKQLEQLYTSRDDVTNPGE
jgi:hypothetical protein